MPTKTFVQKLKTKTPMSDDSSSTGDRLDLGQLSKPFWSSMVIGSLSLLLFVSFLTITMDRGTIRASEQVLFSIMEDRKTTLEGIAVEYGYWDQAVEQIVYQRNDAWIDVNVVESMVETHGIEDIHVLDGKGAVVLNIVGGTIASNSETMSKYKFENITKSKYLVLP